MYESENLEKLVGASVKKIFMDSQHLTFETDKGDIAFGVDGDCCSHSFFYDFYGVKNLLENGEILEVVEKDLEEGERKPHQEYDCVACYGIQITTESKEFGKVTSVFSFRNDSNGYYGGSLEDGEVNKDAPQITDDIIEIRE